MQHIVGCSLLFGLSNWLSCPTNPRLMNSPGGGELFHPSVLRICVLSGCAGHAGRAWASQLLARGFQPLPSLLRVLHKIMASIAIFCRPGLTRWISACGGPPGSLAFAAALAFRTPRVPHPRGRVVGLLAGSPASWASGRHERPHRSATAALGEFPWPGLHTRSAVQISLWSLVRNCINAA